MAIDFVTIAGKEYVIMPREQYARLQGAKGEPRKAQEAIAESIGRNLRRAREHAGLTQAELADALGIGQAMISAAERGTSRVSDRYVRRVYAACSLDPDQPVPEEPAKLGAAVSPRRRRSRKG